MKWQKKKLAVRYTFHQAWGLVKRVVGSLFSSHYYQMTLLWFTMAFVVGGLFQLDDNQRTDDKARTDDISQIVQVAIEDRVQASFFACERANEIRLDLRETAVDLGATAAQSVVLANRFSLEDCEKVRDEATADSPTEADPGGD